MRKFYKEFLDWFKLFLGFVGVILAFLGMVIMAAFILEYIVFVLYNLFELKQGPLVSMGNALVDTILLVLAGAVAYVLGHLSMKALD